MKSIRIIRPVGNWEFGYERDEPDDDCAARLVAEGIAEYIDRPAKAMDKKFHTLSDIVEQERKLKEDGEREMLAASNTTATKVRTKG